MDIATELNLAKNMFGNLDIELRRRIIHYVMSPTVDGWDDICSIIVSNSPFLTIWQAVLEIDHTFQNTGRITDDKGNIIQEWERIPDPDIVKKALFYATH